MSENSCPACSLSDNYGNFPMPVNPRFPKLRAGTQLDAIYERLMAKGKGFFRMPKEKANHNPLVIVYDCRCKWSQHLWETCKALENDLLIFWFPVCVSADLSVPTGSYVLGYPDPVAAMDTLNEEFADREAAAGYWNLPYTPEAREALWNNSRFYRKSGGTVVPLGIVKTADGDYLPFFGDSTAEEIRKLAAGC